MLSYVDRGMLYYVVEFRLRFGGLFGLELRNQMACCLSQIRVLCITLTMSSFPRDREVYTGHEDLWLFRVAANPKTKKSSMAS